MHRRLSPLLPLLLCLLASLPLCLSPQDNGPERDAWQRPAEVMDALGLGPGMSVADVGSGDGYFTFHLAARVGPAGKVYAVDIDDGDLKKIRHRAKADGLEQIETVLGARDNPRLAAESVDVALIVNAYHEMRAYDAMLAGIFRALKPGGLFGIIEAEDEPGRSRESYHDRHRMPAEVVREDAARAGFRYVGERPGFLRPSREKKFYFLVFEKPTQ
jgi:predicted methyltransferase